MARIPSNLTSFTLLLTLFVPGISLAIPFETDEVIARPQEPAMANVVPIQTLNDIRDIMIRESIEKNGYCACPYSTDALGGQCGSLSAYYYPWKKILCYRRDISGDMVHFFRLQRGLNFYWLQEQQREAEEAKQQKNSKDDKSDQKTQPKPDPTADYFRNTARPIPKTVFSTGAPPNSSLNFNNLDSDNLTPSGYFRNYSIPVSPVSNTTNLQAPPAPAF